MGPSPTYHPPEGEECETQVEHVLPRTRCRVLLAATAPFPHVGSRFVEARAVGPWVGEQKPLGKTPPLGSPSPESTYLPYLVLHHIPEGALISRPCGPPYGLPATRFFFQRGPPF